MTTMANTHDMPFARDLSDRVIVMAEGRIMEEGSSPQLMQAPHVAGGSSTPAG